MAPCLLIKNHLPNRPFDRQSFLWQTYWLTSICWTNIWSADIWSTDIWSTDILLTDIWGTQFWLTKKVYMSMNCSTSLFITLSVKYVSAKYLSAKWLSAKWREARYLHKSHVIESASKTFWEIRATYFFTSNPSPNSSQYECYAFIFLLSKSA